MSEHAVIIRFGYGSTDLSPLFELEDQLEAAIEAAGAGDYDGHEIRVDGADGTLYAYGPDADRLFAAMRPVLAATTVLHQVEATLRYGPPEDGVREQVVHIDGGNE